MCGKHNLSIGRVMKRTKKMLFLSFSPLHFSSLHLMLHLMWKIHPLHLLPFSLSSPFCPPFFYFVLSLSRSHPPFPSPLHAVVCRHAGISGPQNDRPNLSALAPFTKDGCLGNVFAGDWCTSELLRVWLAVTCLSTVHVLLAEAVCDCLVTGSLFFCFLSSSVVCVCVCDFRSLVHCSIIACCCVFLHMSCLSGRTAHR